MSKNFQKWVTLTDGGDNKVYICPVINPSGVIKYPRVSPLVSGASLFTTVYDDRDPDYPRLVDIALKPGLESQGWVLVADDFVENGMTAAWPHFQDWMRSTPMMGAKEVPPPWPEKYMPPGCAERRANALEYQLVPAEINIPELDERPAHTSVKKRRAAGVE